MPNKAHKARSEPERRFAEDMARLLTAWGVPQTAARLYGYLLLSAEPASLDDIAADLEISKSTASVAARLLEMYTLARRHGERGSRRARYEASENYEGMLREQKRSLQSLAELLKAGRGVASGTTRDRLEVMAEFYLMIGEAMEAALRRWSARKRK
jgi:DNA-binding transcriptional regulator GbsR (MarR family)